MEAASAKKNMEPIIPPKEQVWLDGPKSRGYELAFAWLLSNKQVASVIAGATNPEQISQHAATVEWKLSEEELKELKEIL